jgi:hypothetical protein
MFHFNIVIYFNYFLIQQDLESDIPEPTDWEKYAAEEYEILVAEEGANEQEEMYVLHDHMTCITRSHDSIRRSHDMYHMVT